MIARRRGHEARERAGAAFEPRDDRVEGATRLERIRMLNRFELEEDIGTGEIRQPRRAHERRPSHVRRNSPSRAQHLEQRHACLVRISPSCWVNADRASTSPTPAWRAALMTSVCTWDAKPTVGTAASAASCFMADTISSGLVRGLLRSRITSVGAFFRISASAASVERAKTTDTPSCLAAVLILDENIKSSSTATIMADHDTGESGRRSLLQEWLRRRMRGDPRGGAG